MMWHPQSNRAEICVGDGGLAMLCCYWSTFSKTRQDIPVIPEAEALAAFAALGEDADSAELCSLLTGSRDAARAIPAYRFQNRFISAENGAGLQ